MAPIILCQLPSDVLDHIAYFLGSDPFLGPPGALVPLLSTNRDLNSRLSLRLNPYLYGRIFRLKYDISAARTRFGDRLTSAKLADELRRRSIVLKRLKVRLDSRIPARQISEDESRVWLREVLFTAYTLILEDEGKNMIQLQQYGGIHDWIREFWFDRRGASLALDCIRANFWPSNRIENALGMWLFWLLFKKEDYVLDIIIADESPLLLLKAMAFGAPTFGLSTTSWVHYDPEPSLEHDHFTLYSEEISFTPIPLAIPAILSYFALSLSYGTITTATFLGAQLPHPAWQELDIEWARCFSKQEANITKCFRPGSIEGIWEGSFMYTEFGAYANILAGAPPSVVQRAIVGRHTQTWKLREYHLLSCPPGSDSSIGDGVRPLPGGDPLKSYFPCDTQLRETKDGLMIQYSGSSDPLQYHSSWDSQRLVRNGEVRVRDIVIIGEGHSAWGQFKLVGRVRPCDGFISLLKDYSNVGRGQWLYRSYLVGNAIGALAGRWRDALTPIEDQGYEGCFVMCRRP